MFFIDDNQAEVTIRQVKRGPCTHDQLRVAIADHFPAAAAFGHGDARMPFRRFHPEPSLNARDEFGCQCNLWQ